MALSKYTLLLLESSAFLKQDIFFQKAAISDTNKFRYKEGEFHVMYEKLRKSDLEFLEYTGMTVAAFDYLLEHVRDTLTACETNYRIKNTIEPEEKLLLTLRYLSTGLSYCQLSNKFRMGRSTVAKTVYTTCAAIWESLYQKHMPHPTTSHLKYVTEQYWAKWRFPNCVGSIGERIIKGMKPKPSRSSKKYCREKFPSYSIHGIADANYKFIAVEVISRETKLDVTFNGSDLNHRLHRNVFQVPPPQKLPNSDVILPNVILGNEGYPLTRYLMRPYYLRTNPSKEKGIFNQRVSHAREPIICAFGMLFAKFKFLEGQFVTTLRNTRLTIETACLLHNIIRDIEGNSDPHFQKCLRPIPEGKCRRSRTNNRSSEEAFMVRDQFALYLVVTPQQEDEEVETTPVPVCTEDMSTQEESNT